MCSQKRVDRDKPLYSAVLFTLAPFTHVVWPITIRPARYPACEADMEVCQSESFCGFDSLRFVVYPTHMLRLRPRHLGSHV